MRRSIRERSVGPAAGAWASKSAAVSRGQVIIGATPRGGERRDADYTAPRGWRSRSGATGAGRREEPVQHPAEEGLHLLRWAGRRVLEAETVVGPFQALLGHVPPLRPQLRHQHVVT